MGWMKLQDINFLSLQTAVFCVECELISENNMPNCLACGSQAVLSLSRVLGGSLRGQQTAHLIEDAELDRLVRELLRTVPASPAHSAENRVPASFAALAPSRHHARVVNSPHPTVAVSGSSREIHPGEIDLEPAISVIAEREWAPEPIVDWAKLGNGKGVANSGATGSHGPACAVTLEEAGSAGWVSRAKAGRQAPPR